RVEAETDVAVAEVAVVAWPLLGRALERQGEGGLAQHRALHDVVLAEVEPVEEVGAQAEVAVEVDDARELALLPRVAAERLELAGAGGVLVGGRLGGPLLARLLPRLWVHPRP